MKKLLLLLALTGVLLTLNTSAKQTKTTAKTEQVKKDSVKKDTSKTEQVILATDALFDGLKEKELPSNEDTWITWLLSICAALPLVIQWLARIFPTTSNMKIFHILEMIANLLIKLGRWIPNKKKGGGKHE